MEPSKPAKKPKFIRNFEQILATSSLNILFVIDTTGSMDPYKNLCAESISLISTKLSGINQIFPGRKALVKFGYVAYRDLKDRVPFEFCEFTEDQEKMITMVKNLQCTGGGDTCEDVKGALKAALSVKWDAQYKFIVMIADSPSHGIIYHSPGESDDNPEEIMTKEIENLVREDIYFLGILFDDSTKQMYDEIEKNYKGNHGTFYLVEHDDLKKIQAHEHCSQNILNLFVDKISKPIEQLTKSTITSFLKEKKVSRAVKLIAENAIDCNWEKMALDDGNFNPEEVYDVYNFTCDPKTINYQNI